MESRRVSKASVSPVIEIKETGDDEQAFLQTQKALIEALNEQKIINSLNIEKNLIDVYFDYRNKNFTNNIQEISGKMEEVFELRN